MELAQLGMTIRGARVASGISQAQLARMVGVSRATINYAEQGRSAIGADTLLRILRPLGLGITSTHFQRVNDDAPAIDFLAASSSVSFKESIPPDEVQRALLSGQLEVHWIPHIATIIDEASDALLLRAVREVSLNKSVPASSLWRNLKSLALAVNSPNPRWA